MGPNPGGITNQVLLSQGTGNNRSRDSFYIKREVFGGHSWIGKGKGEWTWKATAETGGGGAAAGNAGSSF